MSGVPEKPQDEQNVSAYEVIHGSKYTYCLPEGVFDVLEEIEEEPPNISGFSISRLKYILSLITTHKEDSDPGAYSILNMEILRTIVPQANDYMSFLHEWGIIEYENYSSGDYSRKYRITDRYDGFNTVYKHYHQTEHFDTTLLSC